MIFLSNFPTQSSDKTVFFFTVGERYNPVGFIHVPGPVQGLEWSSFPVGLLSHFIPFIFHRRCLVDLKYTLLPRVKAAGCSSCVKVVTWLKFPVLIQTPRPHPKPSISLSYPEDLSGSGASNLEWRSLSVLLLSCFTFNSFPAGTLVGNDH